MRNVCPQIDSLGARWSWRLMLVGRSQSGQRMIQKEDMKSLTGDPLRLGRFRFTGWGPRDSLKRWLEVLGDMADCRNPWRSCL